MTEKQNGIPWYFFLILPIISIALGFAITNYVLIPYVFESHNEVIESNNGNREQINEEQQDYENGYIEEIEFFFVQMGAFNDKSNAESLKNDLNNDGYPAVIIEETPYKVISLVLGEEKQAESIKGRLTSKGYEVYAYSEEIFNNQELILDEGNELALFTELLKDLCQWWHEFYDGGVSYENWLENGQDIMNYITDIESEITDTRLNGYYEQIYQVHEKSLEIIEEENLNKLIETNEDIIKIIVNMKRNMNI